MAAVSLFAQKSLPATEPYRAPLFVHKAATVSTFESISIELPFHGDANRNAFCDVRFRPEGDTAWRNGLRLFADHVTPEKGFRGSLVLLKPSTTYQIHLRFTDPEGGSGDTTIKATTWNETFPTGTVTMVKTGAKPFTVESGTPTAYRVYDGGANKTLLDAANAPFCIDLEGASYVILRNLRLTGSDQHAIRIKNAHHIVVEDCEVAEWGRPGEWCQIDNRARRDGAIYVEHSNQVVIQHNNIHDPRGTTCDWRTAHPNGPRGIFLNDTVNQSVFRYNRIAGSEQHYYDDLVTGDTDGSGSDLDIYGNVISHAWDDGIEIEGKNKNIRVWGNVVRKVFQGLAADNNFHLFYGPVYVWRNVFTDLYTKPAPDGSPSTGNGFKLENTTGLGGMYIFNNTFLGAAGHVRPRQGISNGPQYNLTALNNIFDVDKDEFHQDKVKSGSLFDYNAYSGSNKLFAPMGFEDHGAFGVKMGYTQEGDWNFYSATGKETGVIIPNFADRYSGKAPDLGAVEKDGWEMRVGPHADMPATKVSAKPSTAKRKP